MYSCDICDKAFTLQKNLNRHIKSHKDGDETTFSCDFCDFSSPRVDTLKRHKLSKHSPAKVSSQSNKKTVCVLCEDFSCADRKEMIKHYQSEHDVVFQEESFSFDNDEQFQEWKLAVERSDLNQYVRYTGQRTLVDGMLTTIYSCFRDGSYKPRGSGARHEKMLGSNKIKGCCPARMVKTTLFSGKIIVNYFKTHVGHSNDLGRMRLPKNVRDEIASKVAMQIKKDAVLDSVRLAVTTDELERRHLLTMKDALPRDDLESRQERVKKGLQKLYDTASTSAEDLDRLLQMINQNQATLDAAKTMRENSSFTREEPPSKKRKIEPQRRFVATKKRKKQSSSAIVVPSKEKQQEIAISLMDSSKIVFSGNNDESSADNA